MGDYQVDRQFFFSFSCLGTRWGSTLAFFGFGFLWLWLSVFYQVDGLHFGFSFLSFLFSILRRGWDDEMVSRPSIEIDSLESLTRIQARGNDRECRKNININFFFSYTYFFLLIYPSLGL